MGNVEKISAEMRLKVLTKTPFGFVLELVSDTVYYSSFPYDVYLNGALYGHFKENIFSVFDLEPATAYEVTIKSQTTAFRLTQSLTTETLNYCLDVADYNAKGDGIADDTAAINAAIYVAPKGSVVYLKKGTYKVSQILLKSHVDLYLAAGCTLIRTTDRTAMATLKGYQKNVDHTQAQVLTTWEGNPLDAYTSLIFGYEVHDCRLYGLGVLDGQGEAGQWWDDRYEKKIAYRPRNIFFNQCQHMTVAGLTSQDSAAWNIHPFYSQHLNFYNLKILSKEVSPNTDGLNPESCQDVAIIGCYFNVGDDCIAIKSGKYFMSQIAYQPCQDLIIENCLMGDGHGGVTLGSEISCGVRNLTVNKCYMSGTDRGIRIKTRRGRGNGSILDNIKITNVVMDEVLYGIVLNMYYHCDPDGQSTYVQSKTAQRKDEYTPEVKNIEISGVQAKNLRGCGIFLYGLPESKIAAVKITHNTFSFRHATTGKLPELMKNFIPPKRLGLWIQNAEDLILTDNVFTGEHVQVIEGKESFIKGETADDD